VESYIISRYGQPGPMDEASFGTICKVIHSDNNKESESVEIYVQISNNTSMPNWISIGSFTNPTNQDIQNVADTFLKRSMD